MDASLREAGALPGERPRVLIVSGALSGVHAGTADLALEALREEVDYCVLAPGTRGVPIRRPAIGPGRSSSCAGGPGSWTRSRSTA